MNRKPTRLHAQKFDYQMIAELNTILGQPFVGVANKRVAYGNSCGAPRRSGG
jgi:hypothetical protein